jgi:hypothetical protein
MIEGFEFERRLRAENRRVMAARESILDRAVQDHGGDLGDYEIIVTPDGRDAYNLWLDDHPDWMLVAWLPDFEPSATILVRRRA